MWAGHTMFNGMWLMVRARMALLQRLQQHERFIWAIINRDQAPPSQ
jgi:hypothetical protein